MVRKAKSVLKNGNADGRRGGTWLAAIAVAVFVLILLLRMLVFVAPHGRHRF
jgi:hypothetical protein